MKSNPFYLMALLVQSPGMAFLSVSIRFVPSIIERLAPLLYFSNIVFPPPEFLQCNIFVLLCLNYSMIFQFTHYLPISGTSLCVNICDRIRPRNSILFSFFLSLSPPLSLHPIRCLEYLQMPTIRFHFSIYLLFIVKASTSVV